MNSKQIATFYWAAKLGSFKAAASYLDATQSTISTRIQELEDFFGTPLFDRTRRTVRLTPKGSDLFGYAERFVQLTEEMQACVSATDSISGSVRVGVSEVISATWLPQLVQAIASRFPKLSVYYDVDLVANHLDRLRQGDLDLMLQPRRKEHFGYPLHSLGALTFRWLASRKFALPAKLPLRPIHFEEIPVIALSKNSNNWQTIEEWLGSGSAYCKRFTECNSMNVVAALTIAGQGMGLFPVCSYENNIADGSLYVVDTIPAVPDVEFCAITQNDQPRLAVRAVADSAVEISKLTSKSKRHSLRQSATAE